MDEIAAIEHIFNITDRNHDGALCQEEFSWLLNTINPDAALTQEQLNLIAEEVWIEYANHVTPKGLTTQGFTQLYLDGFANAQQDYELLQSRQACNGSADVEGKNCSAAVQLEAGVAVTVKKQRLPSGSAADATADGTASTPSSARSTIPAGLASGGATPMAGTPMTARSGMLSRTFTPCSDVFDGLITPKVYAAAAGFFEQTKELQSPDLMGQFDAVEPTSASSSALAAGTVLASPETAGLLLVGQAGGPQSSPLSEGAVSCARREVEAEQGAQVGSHGFGAPLTLSPVRIAFRDTPSAGANTGMKHGSPGAPEQAPWVETAGSVAPGSPMSDVFDDVVTPVKPRGGAAAAKVGNKQQGHPDLAISRAGSVESDRRSSWSASQPGSPMSDVFEGLITPPPGSPAGPGVQSPQVASGSHLQDQHSGSSAVGDAQAEASISLVASPSLIAQPGSVAKAAAPCDQSGGSGGGVPGASPALTTASFGFDAPTPAGSTPALQSKVNEDAALPQPAPDACSATPTSAAGAAAQPTPAPVPHGQNDPERGSPQPPQLLASPVDMSEVHPGLSTSSMSRRNPLPEGDPADGLIPEGDAELAGASPSFGLQAAGRPELLGEAPSVKKGAAEAVAHDSAARAASPEPAETETLGAVSVVAAAAAAATTVAAGSVALGVAAAPAAASSPSAQTPLVSGQSAGPSPPRQQVGAGQAEAQVLQHGFRMDANSLMEASDLTGVDDSAVHSLTPASVCKPVPMVACSPPGSPPMQGVDHPSGEPMASPPPSCPPSASPADTEQGSPSPQPGDSPGASVEEAFLATPLAPALKGVAASPLPSSSAAAAGRSTAAMLEDNCSGKHIEALAAPSPPQALTPANEAAAGAPEPVECVGEATAASAAPEMSETPMHPSSAATAFSPAAGKDAAPPASPATAMSPAAGKDAAPPAATANAASPAAASPTSGLCAKDAAASPQQASFSPDAAIAAAPQDCPTSAAWYRPDHQSTGVVVEEFVVAQHEKRSKQPATLAAAGKELAAGEERWAQLGLCPDGSSPIQQSPVPPTASSPALNSPFGPDASIPVQQSPMPLVASSPALHSPFRPDASIPMQQSPVPPVASSPALHSPSSPGGSSPVQQSSVPFAASSPALRSPSSPGASNPVQQSPVPLAASSPALHSPTGPGASNPEQQSPVPPVASNQAFHSPSASGPAVSLVEANHMANQSPFDSAGPTSWKSPQASMATSLSDGRLLDSTARASGGASAYAVHDSPQQQPGVASEGALLPDSGPAAVDDGRPAPAELGAHEPNEDVPTMAAASVLDEEPGKASPALNQDEHHQMQEQAQAESIAYAENRGAAGAATVAVAAVAGAALGVAAVGAVSQLATGVGTEPVQIMTATAAESPALAASKGSSPAVNPDVGHSNASMAAARASPEPAESDFAGTTGVARGDADSSQSTATLPVSPEQASVASPDVVGAAAGPASVKKGTNSVFRKFKSLLGRRNAGTSVTPLYDTEAAAPLEEGAMSPQRQPDFEQVAAAPEAASAPPSRSPEPSVAPEAAVTAPERVAVAVAVQPPASSPQNALSPVPHYGDTAGASPSALATTGSPCSDWAPDFQERSPTISAVEQQLAAAMAGASLATDPRLPSLAMIPALQPQGGEAAASPVDAALAAAAHHHAQQREQVTAAAEQGLLVLPDGAREALVPGSLEVALAALELSTQRQQAVEETEAGAFTTAMNLEARMEQVAQEAGMPPSPAGSLDSLVNRRRQASPAVAGPLTKGVSSVSFGLPAGSAATDQASPALLWMPSNQWPAAIPTPVLGGALGQPPPHVQHSPSKSFSFAAPGAQPAEASVASLAAPTPGMAFAAAGPAAPDAESATPAFPGEAAQHHAAAALPEAASVCKPAAGAATAVAAAVVGAGALQDSSTHSMAAAAPATLALAPSPAPEPAARKLYPSPAASARSATSAASRRSVESTSLAELAAANAAARGSPAGSVSGGAPVGSPAASGAASHCKSAAEDARAAHVPSMPPSDPGAVSPAAWSAAQESPQAEAPHLSPLSAGATALQEQAAAVALEGVGSSTIPAPVLPAAFGGEEMELQHINWEERPKEEVEARIQQLLAQMDRVLAEPAIATADVMGIQSEASQLPRWASHAAHMELGMRLNQKQRHHEALKSFQVAVATGPQDALAHFRMGNAFFAMNKYPEARKAYNAALKVLVPGADDALKPKILINMGITQEAEGLLMAACDYYREVTTLVPSHFRAHKLLGSALYALGDFPGATAALRQSLRLKPDYADAYCDLGCTYCAMGEVEKAKKCFSTAVEHSPHHLEAHFNRGNLFRQLAEFQRAIASYDAVLAIDPSHWRSLLNKAVVQTCTKEKDEAAFNLKLALKLSGQGSVLQQEIDQLKRMLKQGANWEVVSQMMSYISDKAAQVESSGAEGLTPQSKVTTTFGNLGNLTNKMMSASSLMGSSGKGKHAKTKLQRMGYNMNQVVQHVDVPMLQQLQPVSAAKLEEVLAEAVDDNVAWARKGKQIKVSKAEELLRRILRRTPPGLFQHMMRTMHSQVMAILDFKQTGYIHLDKLLMLLVALCDVPAKERLQAAYRIQSWVCKDDVVTQEHAREYAQALKVVFGPAHDPREFKIRNADAQDALFVSADRFAHVVADGAFGFPYFEILPMLVKPLS